MFFAMLVDPRYRDRFIRSRMQGDEIRAKLREKVVDMNPEGDEQPTSSRRQRNGKN